MRTCRVEPRRDLDLTSLRLIGSTGSILPASANAWVCEHVGYVQLGSMSGGIDVVGIFVSSAPTTPVYDGEISAVALGVALEVWSSAGERLPRESVGEMVITEPMPSMPLRFWDDPDDVKLRDTYFSTFPGFWRQGDLMLITEQDTVVILGRSDATINRAGVRLGSADIYEALFGMPGIEDVLAVGVEEPDGGYWFPLFVVPTGDVDQDQLRREVREHIRVRMSPRCVPDDVIVVSGLPHTKTGKRLEVPVKRILLGEDPDVVVSRGAVDDPDALDALATIARLQGGAAWADGQAQLSLRGIEATTAWTSLRTGAATAPWSIRGSLTQLWRPSTSTATTERRHATWRGVQSSRYAVSITITRPSRTSCSR